MCWPKMYLSKSNDSLFVAFWSGKNIHNQIVNNSDCTSVQDAQHSVSVTSQNFVTTYIFVPSRKDPTKFCKQWILYY